MSKMKLNLVAAALVGAVSFTGSALASDPLEKIHAEEKKIHNSAAKSQTKINAIQERTVELAIEYRDVVAEMEINKVYNDHVAKLVAAQNADIASLEGQIAEIENTKRNVVPLMYKMIDMLEEFVNADIPLKRDTRLARVERLRAAMINPNISTSEKYRQVLEAYEIEKAYGSAMVAWEQTETFDGQEITADFVHVGRIALLAQSKDLKNAWVWDNNTRSWEKLGDEYLKDITKTIRMARKQAPMELVKLPIFAAEK
jgi:Spy/CpxP family protein refolding chaperone